MKNMVTSTKKLQFFAHRNSAFLNNDGSLGCENDYVL